MPNQRLWSVGSYALRRLQQYGAFTPDAAIIAALSSHLGDRRHKHTVRNKIGIEQDHKLPFQGIHVFQCPDTTGIVAKISECISSNGANIVNTDIFVDFDNGKEPIFHSRSVFVFDPQQWSRTKMSEDFSHLANMYSAHKSVVRVPGLDENLKVAILASWQDHCLVDLLLRWQEGQLPIEISCIISNHPRTSDNHIVRLLERLAVPYHYLPTSKLEKREEEILELVSSTDFVILARYMQVLSRNFLQEYSKDVINIHHGLLPSFKGANPYKQAYEAGVKLIGATAHFVTEELDSGPLIEQMVDRVSHRDSLGTFALKSENLERLCLARAVQYYCEHRVLRYGCNKTIVFA